MKNTVSNGRDNQFVVFSLSGKAFGIPISQVKEIIKWKEVTGLPNSDSSIEGVTNLRGQVISVISLAQVFGYHHNLPDSNDRQIIIAELEESTIGLTVDSVNEVVRISQSVIEQPPQGLAGLDGKFIHGIAKMDEHVLVIVDVAKLFADYMLSKTGTDSE